jgi:pyruvate decarboxylase
MTDSPYRVDSLRKPVDVAQYLFTRLHQLGVRSVHGLPGDFNLVTLDYLPKTGLKWVGSVNELNAAYAADGYARVKGMGAIVTTFGVGELSAINGLAGAYSEHIPVVHIVGIPSTISERSGMLLHHTLGNGNYHVYADMNAQISCVVAKLNKPYEVADQIDHALRECYLRSRPVYIMLPTDIVQQKIEGARLNIPLNIAEAANDPDREDYVVDVILKYLHEAKSPVILVDACAVRHRVLDEVHDLMERTKIPVFVTPMGKSAVNENHPSYGGVYAGSGSRPEVAKRVESADLVLSIGSLKSDFNTTGFSYRTSQLNTIDLHSTHCVVRYSEYPGVTMRGVLCKVVQRLDETKISRVPAAPLPKLVATEDVDSPITQAWFWPKLGEFLHDNDIVVTETGTANFGIWDTQFPSGVTGLNQVLWGSIGWSVGAAQGAALAARDAGQIRRTILLVGDGSFQLTAQEVSTMVRLGLKMTIFLINNDGYTIERWIHGFDAAYNDIVMWNYADLPAVFGATLGKQYNKHKAATKGEVEKLFADKAFASAEGLQFVELILPRDDAPKALVLTAENAAKRNAEVAGSA